MSIFLYLFVALLLYVLWLPTIRLGLKRVTCSRSFDKTAYYEGEVMLLMQEMHIEHNLHSRHNIIC